MPGLRGNRVSALQRGSGAPESMESGRQLDAKIKPAMARPVRHESPLSCLHPICLYLSGRPAKRLTPSRYKRPRRAWPSGTGGHGRPRTVHRQSPRACRRATAHEFPQHRRQQRPGSSNSPFAIACPIHTTRGNDVGRHSSRASARQEADVVPAPCVRRATQGGEAADLLDESTSRVRFLWVGWVG